MTCCCHVSSRRSCAHRLLWGFGPRLAVSSESRDMVSVFGLLASWYGVSTRSQAQACVSFSTTRNVNLICKWEEGISMEIASFEVQQRRICPWRDGGKSTLGFGDGDEILFPPCIETTLLYIFIYNFTQNVWICLYFFLFW
jgi:hypothetical protein